MFAPTARQTRKPLPGFALLAVLVFIMLLSMLTVSLMFRSRSDETAAHAGAGSEQAWAAAMSGVQWAMQAALSATNGSGDWQDNPAVFRDHLVFDDGSDRWYFTVYSPGGSEDTVEVRYGISDEAGRLNLNHPGTADLGRIPRMTAAMVQSLQQYTGQTNLTGATNLADATRPGATNPAGAPQGAADVTPDLAGGAPPPPPPPGNDLESSNQLSGVVFPDLPVAGGGSQPRRGRLATLDELAQVPGFSWSLLYGEDANLNGHLDPNEDDGDENFPPDNHDGKLDHGMAQYFTVSSYDPDLTSAGRPRVNLNDTNAALPAADLPPAFTNFVAALRSAGLKLAAPSDVLEASINVKDAQGNPVVVPSGIGKAELPLVLDLFTTRLERRAEGLINLNTAGATVLATLPGVDPALADTIVSTRTGLSPERRTTIAWLYQEGLVDAARFKQLAPLLTARGWQFRLQVLGYGIPSGRFRVLQTIVDVGGAEPRITYLRDITRLGLPFKPGSEKNGSDSKDSTSARTPTKGRRHA